MTKPSSVKKNALAAAAKTGHNTIMSDYDIIRHAENGDVDGIFRSIQSGMSVNTQESGTGITPLHAAAANGRYYAVEYLLSIVGIDTDIKDSGGRLAYTLAIDANHRDTAALIEDYVLAKVPGINIEFNP